MFDSLNEAPGRTDCNAKNLNSPNNDFHFSAYNPVFSNFQTPRTEGGGLKNMDFFCIFLTSMYRSSDLAGSKHNFFHYQHPSWRGSKSAAVRVAQGEEGVFETSRGSSLDNRP